jgi:hypothetical protein
LPSLDPPYRPRVYSSPLPGGPPVGVHRTVLNFKALPRSPPATRPTTTPLTPPREGYMLDGRAADAAACIYPSSGEVPIWVIGWIVEGPCNVKGWKGPPPGPLKCRTVHRSPVMLHGLLGMVHGLWVTLGDGKMEQGGAIQRFPSIYLRKPTLAVRWCTMGQLCVSWRGCLTLVEF